MARKTRFTIEEKEEDYKDIEAYLREGLTYPEIASLLGRTKSYVHLVKKDLVYKGIITQDVIDEAREHLENQKREKLDEIVLRYLKSGLNKTQIRGKIPKNLGDVDESFKRISASVDITTIKSNKDKEKEKKKAKVIDLIKKGYYREQIVNETGISRTTLKRIIDELIKDNIIKKEDINLANEYIMARNEEIKSLRKQGWTYKQISQKFGLSKTMISNIINEKEPVKRQQQKKVIEIKEIDNKLTIQEKNIIKYLKIGYSYRTIRKLLKIERSVLMDIVKKLKKERYITQTIINDALKQRKEYLRNRIKFLITNGYTQADILREINKDVEELTISNLSLIVRSLLEEEEISDEEIKEGLANTNNSYEHIDAIVLKHLEQGYTVNEMIEAEENDYITEGRIRRSKKRLINDGKITEEEIIIYRKRKEKLNKDKEYKKDEGEIWNYISKEGLTVNEICERMNYCGDYVVNRIRSIKKRKNLSTEDINKIRKKALLKLEEEKRMMQEAKEKQQLIRQKNQQQKEEMMLIKLNKELKKYQDVKMKIKKVMDEGIDNKKIYNDFISSLQRIIELNVVIEKEDVDILSYVVLYGGYLDKIEFIEYVITLYLSLGFKNDALYFLNSYYGFLTNKLEQKVFYDNMKEKIKVYKKE